MVYICTVMDRKAFLRNSLLGAAAAAGGTAAARLLEQLVKTRFTARPPKIRLTRKDGTIAVGIVETGSQHSHRHERPDGPA